MLRNIPTYLIAGPLGAGKTSLIRALLTQKPAAERWAVLINEFGLIGLDAALLSTDADGVSLAEVAGGCLCCVNGAPFQVGLGRLLRKARPDRLFIEPSGLGHPAELLGQLNAPPWVGVLAIQPLVMVLDATALAAGQALPDSQRSALDGAGLLLLNKAEDLDDVTRARVLAGLPARPWRWTANGALALADLPGHATTGETGGDAATLPDGASMPAPLWRDPAQAIRQVQEQPDGWSIGWRWHPSQRFDLGRLQRWLTQLSWRRAKLVVRSNAGWWSGNALDGEAPHWRDSEWRRDSRIELIFTQAQDAESLSAGLQACRLPDDPAVVG